MSLRKAITLVCACACLTLQAQTNFRAISYEQALQAAADENKEVFIDFYTDWCGPCKKMASTVFPDTKVGEYMNAKFVCLKMNAEKEGALLAAKLGVKAYPTYFILDPKGNVVNTLSGSMDADVFITKLKAFEDPSLSPQGIEARYKAGDRTPELVNNYALQIMQSGNETEGFAVVHSYFDSLTDEQRLLPENSFLFTRYAVQLDDKMADWMIENADRFDGSMRQNIKERSNRLFHTQLASYFSGYRRESGLFVQEEYDALKQRIQNTPLCKDYKYEPMFKLIEGRMAMDDYSFLKLCKKEYKNLEPSDKDLLVMNVSRLMDMNDKNACKEYAAFIRKLLPQMGTSAITISGRVLATLERKD